MIKGNPPTSVIASDMTLPPFRADALPDASLLSSPSISFHGRPDPSMVSTLTRVAVSWACDESNASRPGHLQCGPGKESQTGLPMVRDMLPQGQTSFASLQTADQAHSISVIVGPLKRGQRRLTARLNWPADRRHWTSSRGYFYQNPGHLLLSADRAYQGDRVHARSSCQKDLVDMWNHGT